MVIRMYTLCKYSYVVTHYCVAVLFHAIIILYIGCNYMVVYCIRIIGGVGDKESKKRVFLFVMPYMNQSMCN